MSIKSGINSELIYQKTRELDDMLLNKVKPRLFPNFKSQQEEIYFQIFDKFFLPLLAY